MMQNGEHICIAAHVFSVIHIYVQPFINRMYDHLVFDRTYEKILQPIKSCKVLLNTTY